MKNSFPVFRTSPVLIWLFLICLVLSSPAAWSSSNKINLSAMNSSQSASSNQSASNNQAKSKSPAQSSHQCKADPRLNHIGQVISQIQNGKPPSKPIRIPAARILKFNPAVLKKLAGHYAVISNNCQTIPVVNGNFMQKVTVDFAPLANAVGDAVRSGNKKRLSFLVGNFQAAPVGPIAGLSLVSAAPYTQTLQAKIAKVLDIPMRRKAHAKRKHDKRLLMSDLYVRLGGHLTHPVAVSINGYGNTIEIPSKNGKSKGFKVIELETNRDMGSVLRALGYHTQSNL